jgi:hypothetical protein
MKQNFLYIKVRVEVDKELNEEQLQELAQEMEVTVKSNTEGVKVVDTEIEENATDYEMNNTF